MGAGVASMSLVDALGTVSSTALMDIVYFIQWKTTV